MPAEPPPPTPSEFQDSDNFATVATAIKLEGEAVYAASKDAMMSLTEVLARELGPFGITVNALRPTPVKTDLIRSVPQEKMQALLARQALPRYGEFRDSSNVIDFIRSAGERFRYRTGDLPRRRLMPIESLLERVSTEPERAALVWRDRVFDYRWLLVWIGYWSSELQSRIGGGQKVVLLEGDSSPNGLALLLALIRQNGSGSTQATAPCRTAEV